MPSKILLVSYLSLLVGVNLIFGFLLPIESGINDAKPSPMEWTDPAIIKQSKPDMDALLASGFWGQVEGFGTGGVSASATAEIAAQEANKLRKQVKAIINNQHQKEVVFLVGSKYHRIALDQTLPETSWILVDVGDDWLKLASDGDLANIRLLKLFAGAPEKGASLTD